eukprot:CAMPEP_0197200068 /NCGR_PEP_ID=MMETSP1423-20130617/34206_1 /TAXON_ID=476441 /ORGANISM="Pseudo-nitzschia heimii, Strain UNC1101" /LENGTH=1327 /DNA_ID=CAMNT_0042653941 /DNA_START=677 /DNA_END=4660 /DNA_ORIENTATION=+
MAGTYSVSTSSSRQTELRMNKNKQPRSPVSYGMNIFVRDSPKPDSFKAPPSSESFNPLINANIMDDNVPMLKPIASASKTATPTPTPKGTPAATTKKGSTPSSKVTPSSGSQKQLDILELNSPMPATPPVPKNDKLLTPTTTNTKKVMADSPVACARKSNMVDKKAPPENTTGTSKPVDPAVNFDPPPPPFNSPPLASTPPTSVVQKSSTDDIDIFLSPLTNPTMISKLPGLQNEFSNLTNDFFVAPGLANQKRSIVTVTKRVDNRNSNGNRIKPNPSHKSNLDDSDTKTVITHVAFDDVYERGEELGYGAFATVFVATHKPSKKKYAVKEVDRNGMVWNNKDHLQHEIDTMFKVREGPNIVQLYEVYNSNVNDDEGDDNEESKKKDGEGCENNKKKKRKKKSLCHLVVELMEGGELFDRIIAKKAFTEREARDSIRCVLEALKYMHDRRVVHRDLKPENLLLKSRDKSKLTPVKLADFGFAKLIKSKNGCRSLCGTPGYLAPEILERFPSYDVQCDMWSVGAILFLLLGGYLPFDDENEEKVFDRTRNAKYDFNHRCWNKVSNRAKDLISSCLTINPRKRYTAADCLNHVWMTNSEIAGDEHLDVVDKLEDTRKNAKRKMRAAVEAIKAANRLGGANQFQKKLNDEVFRNYLEMKRRDSNLSYMTHMTTGTRYGHAIFNEDSPTLKPFNNFYTKEELLGQDDYCSVWRCLRTKTKLYYDVKHVHLKNLDTNARKTIADEIKSLKLLRGGPHIIRLLDVFEENNNPGNIFLVFEAMKGGNLLSRIVDKEVYTEREARQVCKTVFTAIDYCHKKKVAHRDIKPQNVFLHEEGDDTSVRVANFGLAKRVVCENSLQTVCGTAHYVAPEILDNKCGGYDQRCDIWSLGVFTYVLLGGYLPFEGVHQNLHQEIVSGRYEFHEEYWSEISDSAKRMIETMLNVDPKQRITLSKALSCKWMEMEEERLVLRDLSMAQNSIRETLKPVAKVKAAVNAILARNKLMKIADMFQHTDTTSITRDNPVRDQTIDEVEEQSFRDSYHWGSQIGIGVFSVVHEVMKKDTKEIYAAKRIDRKSLHPMDAVALHDEIASLEQVSDCEQIVKLYNVFDEPDYTYLVLEIMKGGDLIDRIIKKHNYTEFDAKEVCRTLLMGVAYCHKKKIANRNLKPENLLLRENSDTDVKISDFGFAKTVTFTNSLRTQCGTEGYVAPEILQHHPAYDVSCDMWSVGVILYIVLGGYRPFRDEKGDADEVMRQIRYGEYKFHKKYWDHVSDDAKNLITRMLTVDPVKRITAETALRTRWIQADEISLGGNELSNKMENLEKNNDNFRTYRDF